MTIYLDTSGVLRALVGDGDPLLEWGGWDRAYSSDLMGTEARRVIDRLRWERALDDDALADAHQALTATERAIGTIRLTPEVLRRTGQPMPTVVKLIFDTVFEADADSKGFTTSKVPFCEICSATLVLDICPMFSCFTLI